MKKKNPWKIIPSRDPQDQLYNRRLISYFSLAYSALWFQEVLLVLIIGMYFKQPVDAAIIAALLGVPTSLAGLGFYNYLKACEEEDDNADRATKPEPSKPPPAAEE